jgi:NADPH-dependent glutamate synthase beta subunit-like oxidoreductase
MRMAKENGKEKTGNISLFISKSTTTSRVNKTGSWRFARPRYLDKTAPCSAACPAGVDIPKIEWEIAKGEVEQAWDTYIAENPFPSVCGRVCFHPCESACNRSCQDKPVSINRLDRFLGDEGLKGKRQPKFEKRPGNNRTVAIVGSGPAGLSAAYFLTRLGFSCDVYEAKSVPGGVLQWGIPSYRLPKEILQNEIDRIADMGVSVHCGQQVNEELLDRLKSSNDALYLSCGLGRSISLHIPGVEHMSDGLALLESIQNGGASAVSGDVAVIGGGNTAVDVTRSLIRLGAKPVILYRRRRQDMPAFEHEIEEAVAEGARIVELVSPLAIEPSADGFTVRLGAMKTTDKGSDDRTRVVHDGDKSCAMTFSAVYSGIGADVEKDWYQPHDDGSGNWIHLSHCSLNFTGKPIVYGGDPVMPIKSVTDAIASGKQAAIALDTYFREGSEALPEAIDRSRVGQGPALSMEIYLGGNRQLRASHVVSPEEINTDYFSRIERETAPRISVDRARKTFEEVESTLPFDLAIKEAERCYQCGFCNDCDNCRIFCAEVSIEMIDGKRRIDLDYCKGCGVCVAECPRSAMTIEEEQA